jgi:hypothetical protein
LEHLRALHHPFAFNPLSSKEGLDDLIILLSQDQLEEFSFEIKYDSPDYANAFKHIREA